MGLEWKISTNVTPEDVEHAHRGGTEFYVHRTPNNMGDYDWWCYDCNMMGITRIEGTASTYSAAKRQVEKAEKFLGKKPS